MKKLLSFMVLLLLWSNLSFSKEIFGIELNSNLDDYNVFNLDEKQKLAKIKPPTINKDFDYYTVSFDENKKIIMIVAHHQKKFTSKQNCMNTLKKYLIILNDKLEIELGLDKKIEKSNQIQYFYGSKAGLLFAGSISSIIFCSLNNEKYIGVLSLGNNLDLNLSDEKEIDTSGLGGKLINWNEINKDIYLSCLPKKTTNVLNGKKNTTSIIGDVSEGFLKITKDKKKIISLSSKFSDKHVYETTGMISKKYGLEIEATINKDAKEFEETILVVLLRNEQINDEKYIGKADYDFVWLNYIGMDKRIITSKCKITYSKLF